MAIKVYRFNPRRSYARLILTGKSGNEVVYEFVNGNPVSSIPSKCVLMGEYEQSLLEDSELFKNGTIALEQVTETESEKEAKRKAAAERAEREAGMEKVESVSSVVDAISYVAEHFDMKVKNAREAKAAAEKHGVLFPNLKDGKK